MMFTVFALKKSRPLTDEEREYLRKMLAAYAVTSSGLWLQALPWTDYQFSWCPAMRDSGGVMGCFCPLFPGTVYLLPRDDEMPPERGRQFWIEGLFTTIIHELRHAWQWKKSKFGYILCALPIIREFTLERDATNSQKEADDFAERWIAKMDHFDAKAHGVAEELTLPEDAK